jgi:hypothetical protein
MLVYFILGGAVTPVIRRKLLVAFVSLRASNEAATPLTGQSKSQKMKIEKPTALSIFRIRSIWARIHKSFSKKQSSCTDLNYPFEYLFPHF